MAISFVGSQLVGFAGSTSAMSPINFSLSNGVASVPAAGDLVLIVYSTGAFSSGSYGACGISGYAQPAYLYQNAGSYSSALGFNWKFMGGTPDTTFTPDHTNNANNAGAVAVYVFRGVDPTTPFDVTTVITSGTASYLPNPPTITPVTTGAVVVAGGGSALGTSPTGTYASSDLTQFGTVRGDDTTDAIVGCGYAPWTSGAVNPAQFTGPGGGGGISWVAVSAALRPASGLEGDLTVTEDNDTLAASGSVPAVGALTVTEGADSLDSSAFIPIGGELAVTEDADALVASVQAGAGVIGSLGDVEIQEDDDTLDGAGSVSMIGELSAAEDDDALLAFALVGSNGPFVRRRMLVLNG